MGIHYDLCLTAGAIISMSTLVPDFRNICLLISFIWSLPDIFVGFFWLIHPGGRHRNLGKFIILSDNLNICLIDRYTSSLLLCSYLYDEILI